MYLIRRAGRALPPCRRRRQLSWAFAALVLGTLGGLDLNTVFTRTYPMGWAWCALSSVTLFYAIAQHRLMATRTFIRQALLGTVGVAAGAIIVSFVVVVTPDALSEGGWPLRRGHARHVPRGARLDQRRRAVAVVPVRLAAPPHRARLRRLRAPLARRPLHRRGRRSAWPTRSRTPSTRRWCACCPPSAIARASTPASPSPRRRCASSARPSCAISSTSTTLGAPRLLDALDRLGADALVPLVARRAPCRPSPSSAATRSRPPTTSSPTSCAASAIAPRSPGSTRASITRSRAARPASRRRSACAPPSSKRRSPSCKSAQARLVEAERSSSLGLLVAGVSHEINNALNIIHANLPTLIRYSQRYDAIVDEVEGRRRAGRAHAVALRHRGARRRHAPHPRHRRRSAQVRAPRHRAAPGARARGPRRRAQPLAPPHRRAPRHRARLRRHAERRRLPGPAQPVLLQSAPQRRRSRALGDLGRVAPARRDRRHGAGHQRRRRRRRRAGSRARVPAVLHDQAQSGRPRPHRVARHRAAPRRRADAGVRSRRRRHRARDAAAVGARSRGAGQ